MESTQYYVSIELASKNFPKISPHKLKSVQWFKIYVFASLEAIQPQKSEKSLSGEHGMIKSMELDNFQAFLGRGNK